LTGNVPYGSNTILFSAGLVDPHTQFGKYGLIITKWCFETAEQVVSGSSSNSANLTATFTVPTTLSGPTRMRYP
jgi:hypothetical protein